MEVDLGRLDVVGRALVGAGVPGGRCARDRQPRLDGVAAVRRLHLRVPGGRRRDPLPVSKPAKRGWIILNVFLAQIEYKFAHGMFFPHLAKNDGQIKRVMVL